MQYVTGATDAGDGVNRVPMGARLQKLSFHRAASYRPFKAFLHTVAESTLPYGPNNFRSSESVVFKLILAILMFIKLIEALKVSYFTHWLPLCPNILIISLIR
jgi:hypothetical protein